MTPEQRLERAERILVMLAQAGRRARRDLREQSRKQEERSQGQNEKINMLIQAQMETTEQIKGLAAAQAELTKSQAELTKSQKLTDQTLRSFIKSLNRGENGKTSN